VPALVDRGVQVRLVTPRFQGGDPTEPAAPTADTPLVVHRVTPPSYTAPDIYTTAFQMNPLLEKQAQEVIEQAGGVDLIHVHDWLPSLAAISLKQEYKLPLVSTIHATEFGRNRGQFHSDLQRSIHSAEWWLSYESWRVICCSQFMADEVQQAYWIGGDKIDVIPNGVDSTAFDALDGEDLSDFRARYAAPDQKIIFSVGRVVYEKGAHVLIEAMPRVLAQYPGAKLVVTGEGPHLAAVKARAEQLGVSPNVYFTGFVSYGDRNRLFRVADVAVFPSLYEPFGIVALEAMAAKTPVVVSSVGGLAEVVANNETGMTVFPDNPDSLAWGIVHTLSHPDWARMRADSAYRVATTEYSWSTIAGRTAEVYERVVRERAAAEW
jgi:glycogen synthase